MGRAVDQNIPVKPVVSEPWTFRKLFSSPTNVVTTLAKVFVNPFDVLFAFALIVMAVLELFGREASTLFILLTFWLFAAALFERNKGLIFEEKVEEPKPKKDKK